VPAAAVVSHRSQSRSYVITPHKAVNWVD